MQKTFVTSIAVSALLLATACDQPSQEAYKTRHQNTKRAKPISEAVMLTSKGKKMNQIAAFPVRIDIDRNDSSLGPNASKSTCDLKSETFNAKIKLGDKVNLPSYGRQTPPMTVTCELNGKTLSKTVKAVNLTERSYQNEATGHMLIGFGLLGAMVTAGQASNRDKSKDIFGYPQQIEMK
jgi:hypothetical protein